MEAPENEKFRSSYLHIFEIQKSSLPVANKPIRHESHSESIARECVVPRIHIITSQPNHQCWIIEHFCAVEDIQIITIVLRLENKFQIF